MQNIDYEEANRSINYAHSLRKNPATNFSVDFHLHSGCELFFLISGDVNYFVEKKLYPLKCGELIITNNHEIHKPSFQSDIPYERITIEFNPNIFRSLSSDKFDLLNCFYNRPLGEQNKITLNSNQLEEVQQLLHKIECLKKNLSDGDEILILNHMVELLVYINKIFFRIVPEDDLIHIPKKLIPILNYIDQNLELDLSLEALEKQFYINRYYLSKLFKRSIGSTIHTYITYKRISKAKKLLSEGVSVTDTCGRCGFNDYSNFLVMFRRTVGVSPGKYKSSSALIYVRPK